MSSLIYPKTDEEMMWFKLSLMFEAGSNRFWETFTDDNIVLTYNLIADKPGKFFRDFSAPMFFESHVNELADNVLTNAQKKNIGIITYANDEYPFTLREIYNPPMVLYYQGDISLLKKTPCLAIVGARSSQTYALEITDKLIRSLKKFDPDYVFVSGFALGTDIASHLSAIRNGCKTIAVKACGVDYAYPTPNMRFVPEILAGGVIISEYPPGTVPNPPYFTIRNRIIAALSDGVVVTEASVKSGTISTANLATDFGKDVFVLPPRDITDPRYQGNSKLIRDGAIPLLGTQDILVHNRNFVTDLINLQQEKNAAKTSDEAEENNTNAKKVKVTEKDLKPRDGFAPPPDFVFNSDTSALADAELSLLDIIKSSPGTYALSSLADNFGNDPDEVLDIITDLELYKFVYRAENGRYY